MPSLQHCVCNICDTDTSWNNIAKHLGTHKTDLVPFLVPTPDLFATVRNKDVEYYCCFGCKRAMKDRAKLRNHMKLSDECVKKNKDFLRDLGVNMQEQSHDDMILRGLKDRIQTLETLLTEYKDNNTLTTKITTLETNLQQALDQIRKLESAVPPPVPATQKRVVLETQPQQVRFPTVITNTQQKKV